MDFGSVKEWKIPEGNAVEVKRKKDGVTIWKKKTGRDIKYRHGMTNTSGTVIDTGIKVDSTKKISMGVSFKCGTLNSFYVFQARDSNGSPQGISGSQTNATITAFGLTSNIVRTVGHEYYVVAAYQPGVVNIGVLQVTDMTTGEYDQQIGTGQLSSTSTNIGLFGNLGKGDKLDAGTTIYKATLYVDGEMVWEVVPADVEEEEEVVWNTVSEEVVEPTSGSVTMGGIMTRVADVEDDGSAYFDFAPVKTNGKFEFTAKRTPGDTHYLFGTYPRISSEKALGAWIDSGGNFILQTGNGRKTVSGRTVTEYEISTNNGNININENEYEIGTLETLHNFIIGSVISTSSGSVYSHMFRGKLNIKKVGDYNYYMVKIEDENEAAGYRVEALQVESFIPIKRVGTFIAGNEVPWDS